MARNFIASNVSDLEDAGRSASASVMGPAIRDITTDLLNDWTDNTKFYEELSKASDGAQAAIILHKQLIIGIEKQIVHQSQEQSNKIVATGNKLIAYRQEISVGESTSFGIGPEAAMAAFKETTNYIINKQKSIDRAEKGLTNIKAALESIEDDDWMMEEDLSKEELKKAMKDKKMGKDDVAMLDLYTKKKTHFVQKIQEFKQEIFSYFDNSLGGIRTKHHKKDLSYPSNLNKATAEDIVNATRAFFAHRADEFWAIIPYTQRIMEGYDNQSGMRMKPPVISHDDTVTDRSKIDDSIYKAYVDQADSFYDVLQEALGAEEMTKLLSSFPCGMHNSETAVCYEQDGPTAVYCILSKYARQDTHGLQAIENQFMQAAEHFKYGRPSNKLQVLRPLLQKAINTQDQAQVITDDCANL